MSKYSEALEAIEEWIKSDDHPKTVLTDWLKDKDKPKDPLFKAFHDLAWNYEVRQTKTEEFYDKVRHLFKPEFTKGLDELKEYYDKYDVACDLSIEMLRKNINEIKARMESAE